MKNQITALILALGLIISVSVLGSAFKNRNKSQDTISVTGLGTASFTSDLITWNASFTETRSSLQEAYAAIENDRKVIAAYLTSNAIKSEDYIFSAVDINKEYAEERDANGYYRQGPLIGYRLTQRVSIESKEVEKIEKLSRSVTEIINKGIELNSSQPSYFYTKLAELKHQLIADGTKDARERAEQIAKNSKAKLGALKDATTGVIQITAPNSNEDYSWGGTFNTTSKEKVASITIRLEYEIR